MKTPIIHIRSYSTDQYFLDKVFYSNFYRLKKLEEGTNKVVIDIGAHCGYFTLSAMSAGYSKCFSFEPFIDNFRMLFKNTEVFSNSVVPCYVGLIKTEALVSLEEPKVRDTQFIDYGVIKHSESPSIGDESTYFFPLRKLISGYMSVYPVIDLVKINTGYSFDFATENEAAFEAIQNICFEMPYTPNELSYMKKKLTELGFKESLILELSEKNQSFGFLGFFSKNSLEDVFDVSSLKDKNYEIPSS